MIQQQFHKATKKESFSSSSSSSVCSSSTASTASLSPIHVGCGLDRSCPTSVTSLPSRIVKLDHYQIGAIRNRCLDVSSNDNNKDDDFEWYDLDAIDGNNASHTAIRHNDQAGLVFTTERQRLRKQAKTNRFVDPLVVEKIIHQQNNGPATLIISWIRGGNNNQNNRNDIIDTSFNSFSSEVTTRTDRDLDEEIQSLEQELNVLGSYDESLHSVSISSL